MSRGSDALPALPPRSRDAHKGDFGRVLVVGGSREMAGAAALTALAALRSGAGLVHVATPAAAQSIVATLVPCATTSAQKSDAAGRFAAGALADLLHRAADASALALGPGMGRSPAGARIVAALVTRSPVPVVLDADGLNNAADAPRALSAKRRAALVLTPHPGEAVRLLQALDLSLDPRRDRRVAATALARATQAVVVLKGHKSIVTDGRRDFVNSTGNPGMATGGSGDVLTGVIAALIGQGLEPFDAARLGVFVHGRAGDLAAAALGETALIATDLIEFLPAAWRERNHPGRRLHRVPQRVKQTT